jgi:hypothetical protein
MLIEARLISHIDLGKYFTRGVYMAALVEPHQAAKVLAPSLGILRTLDIIFC